ncbi:DUF502 domain-containing protein [Halovenus rubra]|uniref:DUF502 domain-containing protein n=2 Tax=Halovenus rubra TaxID=869890 RepID=A0ACC7E163_9EURY|nr:DUF502 domain-containing protein [Halovenus rubra]
MTAQSFWGRISQDMLAGLAFFLPLLLLTVVLYGLAGLLRGVGSQLYGLLNIAGVEGPVHSSIAIGLSLVVVPLVFVVCGAGLRHRYGGQLGDTVDRLITRAPGVGPIYNSLRRSRRVVLEDGSGFRDVVSIELTDGVDVLAFVVGRQSGANWTDDDERVTVFVPLAPNPTIGGHLLAVRQGQVTETTMSVPDALTILATVGAGGDELSEPPVSGLYRDVGGTDLSDT